MFDAKKKSVDALEEGTTGYVVLGRDAVLRRIGRPDFRPGLDRNRQWRPHARRPASRAWARACRARIGSMAIEQRIASRDIVTAEVDAALRDATRRNHTATHLLHAALRKVLGGHVKQAGSLVAPDRLRFDFMHFSPVTREAVDRGRAPRQRSDPQERRRSTPASATRRKRSPAARWRCSAKSTATRCAWSSIGDGAFSTELCGGTHVRATGDIGLFLITEESGVAAGVRRIEAVTGLGAYELARTVARRAGRCAAKTRGAKRGELGLWIEQQPDVAGQGCKRKSSSSRPSSPSAAAAAPTDDDKIQIGESTLIAREMSDVDPESLRTLADTLKSRLTSGIVVLAAAMPEGKVSLVVTVTPDLAKKAPAGQLVKHLAPIVGGGGGGRADFAQAGGKDAGENYRTVGGCPERSHSTAGLIAATAVFPVILRLSARRCGTDRKLPSR